jgi:hypothetical protein
MSCAIGSEALIQHAELKSNGICARCSTKLGIGSRRQPRAVLSAGDHLSRYDEGGQLMDVRNAASHLEAVRR